MNKTSEETLLKTPVFDVVKKSFDGTSFQPVGLNCPDWVMVIVKECNNSNPVCLFVNQTRWGIEGKTIEFPCGMVEEGEEPADAAIRELKEETGIKYSVDDLKYEAEFNPNPAYFNNTMHIYSIIDPYLFSKFNNRKNQSLDENEDCKVFLDRIDNVITSLCRGAMGLIAYNLV